MSKLQTIKGKGRLQEFTDYVAVKANETQWNGNFRMCERYIQFKEALEKMANEDDVLGPEVAALLPSIAENIRIKSLLTDLSKFQSVSLLLQKQDGDVHLNQVRVLFDTLINDYSKDCEQYLGPTAAIVNNPDFDSCVIKVLNDEHLSVAKEAALKRMERGPMINLPASHGTTTGK